MPPDLGPLNAVLNNPWPDAPRRAFAAFLADPARSGPEHDPARARFVTLGLDLARALRERDSYSRCTSIEAEQRAVAPLALRELWQASLMAAAGGAGGGLKPAFGRGFPERITIDAATFLARAPDLYAAAPILDLVLADVTPVADELFESPFLARIRSLDFARAEMTAVNLKKLASSPFLGKLLWLNLYGQPCGMPGLEALARSRALPALSWVGGGGRDTPDVNPRAREDESGVIGHEANPIASTLAGRFGSRLWLERTWDSQEPPRPEALTAA